MPLSAQEVDAHFNLMAKTYEETFTAVTEYAGHALDLLPPIDSDSIVHDNACGPGIVTGVLLQRGKTPAKIHATDLSPAMIEVLKSKPIGQQVETAVMDVRDLKFPDATFTHSITNFIIMALPGKDDAAKAMAEVHRTLKPGGAAEVATWSSMGWMQIFQDAVDKVKPGVTVPRGGVITDHWLREDTLVDALTRGGFARENITVKQVTADTAGDLWVAPALKAMKTMVFNQFTAGWDATERKALEEALEARIAEEVKAPKNYPVVAHLAVARK